MYIMFEPVSINLIHSAHNIDAQIENGTSQIMLEVANFQEVTTVDERIRNIAAFSFSVLVSDLASYSFDLFTGNSLNRDIIQLQWETVNTHSRGLVAVMAEINSLHQGHNGSEDAMMYRFTVNTTDLGEGPLLLTLLIKLKCIQSCANNCSRYLYYQNKQYYQQRCTCTQWQYKGESETILVSAMRGESIGNVDNIRPNCAYIHNLSLTHYSNYFSAIGESDVVSFRDITTDSDLLKRMAVFEVVLGPLTGLNNYLTYDAFLHWSQVGGNQSGTIRASQPGVSWYRYVYTKRQGYDGTVEKVTQNGTTYRISVPMRSLGDGPLLVSLTINLYCISYTDVRRSRYYYCNCSEWQVSWTSDPLVISAKKG